MKDSATYAKKIKKLLANAPKVDRPEPPAEKIPLLIRAVLAEDTTPRRADEAFAALTDEFVDYNELRVSPIKDIVECLGRGFPLARRKAERLTGALNAVFEHSNVLSLEYLDKKAKREIRGALRDELGLSPYAESVLTLFGFDGHAIPVDDLLVEALKLDELIHPESDLPDLQGFLERIILARDAIASHEALRAYAAKNATKVARERARRAKEAQAEAEARAKAEQQAREKAEAEAAAEQARKESRERTAAKSGASKKTAKRATAKTARKKTAAGKAKKSSPAGGKSQPRRRRKPSAAAKTEESP